MFVESNGHRSIPKPQGKATTLLLLMDTFKSPSVFELNSILELDKKSNQKPVRASAPSESRCSEIALRKEKAGHEDRSFDRGMIKR
jgi:hypothetical protein